MNIVAERVRKEHSQPQSRLRAWLADIKLFGSVYVARFIVWRALRRERKEKGRLKQ